MSIKSTSGETRHSDDDSSSTDSQNDHPSFTGVLDVNTIDPILRHLTELVREYKIVVNEYGLHISVVDSSNVAAIDVRIHRDDFEEFHVDQQGIMGVSHDALERTRDFVDDGTMHIDVDAETRMMTVTDESERMFYDVALIDPDSISNRKMDKDFEPNTSVTVDGDMFAFKKWVRSSDHGENVAHFQVRGGGTAVIEENHTSYKDDPESENFVLEDGGVPTDVRVSLDYLYEFFKKPLKSQLNGTPYTFTFHGDDMPMTISRRIGDSEREFDDSPELLSYISLTIAPNMSHDMD